MEGVQGWMAEIERKQTRMTRFGGAAAILAVLASAGALALGVINQQNAATEDDLDGLTEQVNELGASVKSQTEKQLKVINAKISGIEERLTTLEALQAQQATEIQSLQSSGGAKSTLQPAVPGAKP
jgi:uncharacterized protein HemX